jgi:hypothetical protein
MISFFFGSRFFVFFHQSEVKVSLFRAEVVVDTQITLRVEKSLIFGKEAVAIHCGR